MISSSGFVYVWKMSIGMILPLLRLLSARMNLPQNEKVPIVSRSVIHSPVSDTYSNWQASMMQSGLGPVEWW